MKFESTDTSKMPEVSIVTVVFNGGAAIEDTIKSVASQTLKSIEYIVLDGGSTDNTLSVLKKYTDQIDFWQSEPDGGIYDAMNKSLSRCNGRWVIFMNAGDTFYENQTLEKFINGIKDSKDQSADLVFGDVVIVKENGTREIRELKNTLPFLIRRMICHQCIFYSKKLLNEVGPFDTRFRYTADFDHLMKVKVGNFVIRKINLLIANYKLDGVSAQKENIRNIWKERMAIFAGNDNIPLIIRLLFWSYAKLAYEFRKFV